MAAPNKPGFPSGDVSKYLARLAVNQRLHHPDRPAWVNPRDIEPDGRKQSKAIRNLVEAGLIEKSSAPSGPPGGLVVAAKTYDLIPEEDVDIVALWRERFNPERENTKSPFVRALHWVSPGQTKRLIESSDQYDWYAANDAAILGSSFPSERDAIGPLPLVDAQSEIAAARNKPHPSLWHLELVVSSPELRSVAAEAVRAAELDRLYRENLSFGLRSLGIVDAAEGERIRCGPMAVFGSGGADVWLGDDPETWPTAVGREFVRLTKKLVDTQSALDLLAKIERGVADAGGWAAALAKYREALESSYDEQRPEAVE